MSIVNTMRDILRQHDIYISENELQKLFDKTSNDFKKRQEKSGEIICAVFDRILNNSGEKLHSMLTLTLFACDRVAENKNVVYGQSANDELNGKLENLKKLIYESLQFLTTSVVLSNVFSKLMYDKDQATENKPENLAG